MVLTGNLVIIELILCYWLSQIVLLTVDLLSNYKINQVVYVLGCHYELTIQDVVNSQSKTNKNTTLVDDGFNTPSYQRSGTSSYFSNREGKNLKTC